MADEISLEDFKDLDETKALEALVKPGENGTESPLAKSWRSLQVCSNWGVRLPTTDSNFSVFLSADDLASFSGPNGFYPNMRDGCQGVSKACFAFNSDLLPKVIDVGVTLSSFANDQAEGDGDMLQVVIDMLQPEDPDEAPDFESAKELLEGMVDDSKAAQKKVADVLSLLGDFKSEISKANGLLTASKKSIDDDGEVNDALIASLTNPALATSISQMNKMKDTLKDEYDHDVVVASTTVTYAWVIMPPPIPSGLIAAAIVAGIYGHKAVQALDDMNNMAAQIDAADVKLRRAIHVHSVYHTSSAAAEMLIARTQGAIDDTKIVQDGWTGISKHLVGLASSVGHTMSEQDGDKKLKRTRTIVALLKNGAKKWAAINGPLNDLTKAPYITIHPGEQTVDDVIKDVKKVQEAA